MLTHPPSLHHNIQQKGIAMSIFTYNEIPLNEITSDDIEKYYGFIYLTLDTKHNKIYIGQRRFNTINSWYDYMGSGVIIRRIIKNRGKSQLRRFILKLCTSDEIDSDEIYFIKKYNSMDREIGYNLCEGGNTTNGLKLKPTQVDVIRVRTTKLWKTPKYRELKIKQSKLMWEDVNCRNKIIKSMNESWTDERRYTHAKQVSDRYKDPEYKKKCSDEIKSRYQNKEFLKKVCKLIRCVDMDGNLIWEDYIGKKGLIELKLDPKSVYQCCNGKQKSHKGFNFSYIE